MSEVPVWSCNFQPADTPVAAPLDNLTVGEIFRLSCRGDIEVPWKEGVLHATFPNKESEYTLYVLKSEKLNTREAELLVTAYRAGDHKPEYIRILQGDNGFEFLKPAWTVKSVLKPNEKTQAYPSFGPWNLAPPLWFLLAVVSVLLVVGYLIFRTVRRYNQRARMLSELERHKTALLPLHQYYRDARTIRRKLNNVKHADELNEISREMNIEFRLYILRQFQIPALDWTDREIVRDMKKRHKKVYYNIREPLRRTLRELARLTDQKQLLFKDVEQMHRMSLEAIEKIDGATSKGRR